MKSPTPRRRHNISDILYRHEMYAGGFSLEFLALIRKKKNFVLSESTSHLHHGFLHQALAVASVSSVALASSREFSSAVSEECRVFLILAKDSFKLSELLRVDEDETA